MGYQFLSKNKFQLASEEEKNKLLKRYWKISERQIENSVVLADEKGISEFVKI